MRQFTEKDMEIYSFISHYQEEKGYSPTVREIARGLYISKTAVHRHLYKMVELGYVTINPRTPRSIVLKVAI